MLYSENDIHCTFPDFFLNIDRNNVKKLNELETHNNSKNVVKYYNLGNALPDFLIMYLENLTKNMMKIDESSFPGKKIYFLIYDEHIKRMLKTLSFLDSSFKEFVFSNAINNI